MPTLLRRHFSLRTLLYWCVVITLCTLFASYVIFQARHIIVGPRITLLDEIPAPSATTTRTLHGIAENIVSLSLNGKTIYTDDAGVFQETLVLPLGYTVVNLTAEDRYGRVYALERTYVRTETQETIAVNH